MVGQQVEAVYENGVFRPLQPVSLPDKLRVTIILPPPHDEDMGPEVEYTPLPPDEVRTVRVRVTPLEDFGPLPYPLEPEDSGNK